MRKKRCSPAFVLYLSKISTSMVSRGSAGQSRSVGNTNFQEQASCKGQKTFPNFFFRFAVMQLSSPALIQHHFNTCLRLSMAQAPESAGIAISRSLAMWLAYRCLLRACCAFDELCREQLPRVHRNNGNASISEPNRVRLTF